MEFLWDLSVFPELSFVNHKNNPQTFCVTQKHKVAFDSYEPSALFLFVKMDLFTDMVAILNSVVLDSYCGMVKGKLSIYTML